MCTAKWNLKNLATKHEYLIGQQKHVTKVSLAVHYPLLICRYILMNDLIFNGIFFRFGVNFCSGSWPCTQKEHLLYTYVINQLLTGPNYLTYTCISWPRYDRWCTGGHWIQMNYFSRCQGNLSLEKNKMVILKTDSYQSAKCLLQILPSTEFV